MRISLRGLTRLTILAGLLLASVHQTRWAEAQEAAGEGREPRVLEVNTRFADTLTLTRAKGTPSPFRVEFKEWHLAGQNQPIPFPEQGFYVAQLVWGAVTTQIGGASQARKPSDFWAVEKGAKMVVIIQKPGEEALLQTFSVNPGR